MEEYRLFCRVKFKDGRIGSIVDRMGSDYVVDIGADERSFETILVSLEDILGETEDELYFCPVYEKEIDEDLCYESLQCLHKCFKVSSVPELAAISDIEKARELCKNCPKSNLS